MLLQLVKRTLLNRLKHIEYGEITLSAPHGESYHYKGKLPGAMADIKLRTWRVILNLILKGDVGFAKDYRDGYWHTTSIEQVLLFAMQNENIFNKFSYGGFIFKQLSRLTYFTRRNNLRKSKDNIQAHYDLGNDFYQLWLDKTMTYSAALFTNTEQNLEEAQYNKYQRLLDKINTPQANILEIGCGWGGFARLASAKGHNIKGITLSQYQYSYAQSIAQSDNITIALEDYRHQQGKYDAIVSIEMLEAVGEKYWSTYFNKLAQLVKKDGKILIQVITIDDEAFASYRKSADMIRTFIFPGGMLPCEKVLQKIIARSSLRITEIFRFGKDYAKTLRVWLNNFNQQHTQVKALGFDDKFIRLWQFYLSLCSAGFEHGRINVIQLELTHAA